MYTLKVADTFSAAHNLRGYAGKCEGVHGHNWKVEAEVRAGAVDDVGISIDFRRLKSLLKAVLDDYDHRDLNRLPEFATDNPSAEHIARNIHRRLWKGLAGTGASGLRVTVHESENASCAYEPGSHQLPAFSRQRRNRATPKKAED